MSRFFTAKNRSRLRQLGYCLLALGLAIGLGLGSHTSASAVLPAIMASSPPAPIVVVQSTTPEQLRQQGREEYAAGQYTSAIERWRQAAQAFGNQGDALHQAQLLSDIAIAHHQLAEWSQAEDALATSLDILTGAAMGNRDSQLAALGQVFNTEGRGWLMRSQPTEALSAFEQAAIFYTDASDEQGLLRAQLNQAQALQALGFYRRSLTLLQDLQPRLMAQSDAALKSTGLQQLGSLYRITGDLVQSENTLQAGLGLAQASGQAEAIASALYSLGQTAHLQGDLDAALERYQQAASVAPTRMLRLQILTVQVGVLQGLAEHGDIQGDALVLGLGEVQAELEALPTNRLSVYAQLDVARQFVDSSGDYGSSVAEWLGNTAQQARSLADPRAESFALGYLGELYLKRQQYAEAQTVLQRALNLSEQLAADDIAYQWQWQLGKLNWRQGKPDAAIAAYTDAVNTLQRLRSDLVAINPDLQFDFREQVEPVYRELVDLLLQTAKGSNIDDQPSLLKARDVIESLQLAELENFFREPCVAVRQQIDQVVDAASSPTAIIYPIVLRDRLEVILKLPNQPLQHYATAVTQTELEAAIQAFRRQVTLPYTLNQVKIRSKQLHDWLLQPATAALATAQIETLVFVQDGALRNLPVAALYDGQQYLVENYSLALAPGLKLVDPQPLQERSLAVIAAGLSEARHGFSPLDFVRSEVAQIQSTLNSRVLLDQTFTQDTLEAEINRNPFPIVHLATHGQFSSNLEDTFVLAWDTPIAINTLNRLLRNSEQNRQDAIELLVLSACQTATGDKRAALGLAGVAVRAGARSTLASLWNLDDETGSILMEQFYQALSLPETTKATALRQAQLTLLRNPGYQHPRYWAPYVLLGNWL